jgi:hypothetical protein
MELAALLILTETRTLDVIAETGSAQPDVKEL